MDRDLELFTVSEPDACPHCPHAEYFVLGPDGIDVGISFQDEEGAADHADIMNRGASAGADMVLEAVRKWSQRRLSLTAPSEINAVKPLLVDLKKALLKIESGE